MADRIGSVPNSREPIEALRSLPSVTSIAPPMALDLTGGSTVVPNAVTAEFEDFFLAEYAGVARYCWSLVRQREQAEDLAQEAFSLVLGKWNSVQDPRGYVYKVATNLVRRAWTRQALDRRRHDQLCEDLASESPDAAQVLVLRDALARIPRRHRDVVLLHYYAGFSTAEVALAVGRPQGTVKRHLSEARALLTEQLS
jgi:RNA polymerase sigma-70 factor (ECF subfamily)